MNKIEGFEKFQRTGLKTTPEEVPSIKNLG
jgi:hypothetical protein